MVAVLFSSTEMVALLLDKKANPHLKDSHGTSLSLAACDHKWDKVKLFLSREDIEFTQDEIKDALNGDYLGDFFEEHQEESAQMRRLLQERMEK